jgi:hypothetical protein
MSESTRISTREFLEHKIDALREHIDHRFDGLANADVDHENRIRALEKARPVRTVAEIVTGIVALVAMFFGVKNQ